MMTFRTRSLLLLFNCLLTQWCAAQKTWVISAGPHYSLFSTSCECYTSELNSSGKLGGSVSVHFSPAPADSTKQFRILFGVGYTQRAFSLRYDESGHNYRTLLDADVRYGSIDMGFVLSPAFRKDGGQRLLLGFRFAFPIWALMRGTAGDSQGTETFGWRKGLAGVVEDDLRLTLGFRNRIGAKAPSAWWVDFGVDLGLRTRESLNSTDIFLRCTRTLPW